MIIERNTAHLFLLVFLLAIPAAVSAQLSEMEVMLSGTYHWGKGFGENQQEAINDAKRDLIERMIVTVVSESSLNVDETDDSFSSEFKSQTNTLSRLQIRGLEYLPPKQKRNGGWEAVAYVLKEDFSNSMKVEEERLLLALEQALTDEKEGNLDSAMRQYFDLLASTYFYPTPFFTNEEQHGKKAELRAFLNSKINSWLNNTILTVTQVRSLSSSSNTELYIDLILTYQGTKTGNFTVSLNRPGYASHTVHSGEVSVFIDLAPEKLIKDYVFLLKPVIPDNIEEEKKELLKRNLSSREISVEVDFSDVILIDFNISESDDAYSFSPKIQNLSVFDLQWDFGDGNTSTKTKPAHKFADFQSNKTITLTVNRQEDLSISKTLRANGVLVSQNIEENPDTSTPDLVTDSSQEESIPPPIPYFHKSYIDEIIRMKNASSLAQYLNTLGRNGAISLGRKSDVPNPDDSYIAIVDPGTRQVYAILTPVNNKQRFNLSNNVSVEDSQLADEFRGFGSIWFQFK